MTEITTEKTDLQETEQLEKGGAIAVPFNVTSFAELDATMEAAEIVDTIRDLTKQFSMLAENILFAPQIEDKASALTKLAAEFMGRLGNIQKEIMLPLDDYIATYLSEHTKEKKLKTEGGVGYPAKDFAFVPNKDKPSTWKLRLTEGSPGHVTIKQLGRAAAAFSKGGFRGNKVSLPSNQVAKVKRRIRAEYKKLDVEAKDIPDSVKETPMMVWKEADGSYSFIAVYSNNFRDNDSPSDIISKESHVRFDELLAKGKIAYPELWLWHRPEWKSGQVTAHAWDDSGFAIAFGKFDKECAPIAEWLIEKGSDIAVSHGMPKPMVKRSDDDPSIIVEHITREISPLPMWSAANKLTGFLVLDKEDSDKMAILDEKRKALLDMGLGENVLTSLEEANAQVAQNAEKEGIESKEADTVETDVVENVTDETEDLIVEEEVNEVEEPQEQVEVKEEPVTRLEIAEAFNAVLGPITESITSLMEQMNELKKELESVRGGIQEQVEQEQKESVPAASLIGMITGGRAIGNQETEVKETELTGGPKEKEAAPETLRASPIPFINTMLTQQQGR